MFDGAVAVSLAAAEPHPDASHTVVDKTVDAPAPTDARATTTESLAAPAPTNTAKQVVFVESNVANYQTLLAQMPTGAEVVVLDSSKDGLAQIAQWASQHQGYAAIHILSHGESADLMLGSLELTQGNIASHQAELATIGQALQPGGDILLYGCDIGVGSSGATFVSTLSSYTHADVAASTDATGAASLGGNWTLERSSGQIDVDGLHLDYDGLLARPVTGTTDFSLSDGYTYNPSGSVVNAGDVQGWDFTLQLGSTNNGGQVIIIEKPGSVTTETVDGYSDGNIPISYFSVKSNDNSHFTLNSIGVVLNGYDSGTSGGNLQLVGYINGVAVSGATLTLNVGDALQGSGTLVTFNVSGNSAFQGIDSFRVLAASGHNVTGMIGIGAIDAINFGFAPVLTASGGSSAYSSGTGTAVTVDSGITLSDSDSSTQASATVSVTGNFHSGEDVLAFTNNGSTMGNITASYNSGTGVLTLTSSGATATLAQWQAALRAVTYSDSSLSPNTSSRTISFAINDGAINSSAVTKTVTVAADSAPVIGNLNGDSPTFTEKGGAVKLDASTVVTVTDSDTPNFNSGNLTVHISANGQSGEDVLGIDTSGTVSLSNGTSVGSVVSVGGVSIGVIATNGDGVSGHDLIVTLNSNGTPSRVATLAAALTYNNTSSDPSTATRTVNVSINDGRGGTGSSNVTVAMAAVNDAPTGSATASNPTFTMGGSAVAVFSGASISTVESSQSVILLTLTVSGLQDGSSEILSIDGSNVALTNGNALTTSGNGLSVTVSVSSGTATVSISSSGISASTAGSVVNGITYRDSSGSPSIGNRVVTLTSVKDNGGTSNGGVDTTTLAVASTVSVAVVPVVTTSGGSAAFTAGDNITSTPVVVDSGLMVTDSASSTLASATVAITGNFHSGEDVLAFTNDGSTMGNIVASYNAGTGVLTLTSSGATATLAQWQAALRAVTYTDTAITPNSATRTISFQVDDGSASSSVVTRTVTVTPTDQTPIVTISGGSAAFTAGDNAPSTPVTVDPALTVADLDNATLASATVAITGNFQNGEDVLAFSNTNSSTYGNIVGSYNSGTGVLTLASSGATATLAQWQAALRAITYTDTAITPNNATRTVSFQVDDGSKSSAAVTRTVTVTPTDQTPIATTSGGSAAFTAGDNVASTPVTVDPAFTVADLDNTTLVSATVAITGNFQSDEDVLAFSNTNSSTYGNIVGSYNAGTGVLTLTSSGATATLAQWQAALRAITYTDTAITPSSATRTVSFQVDDGSKSSATVTRTITVTQTDQTPIATTSSGSGTYVIGSTPAPVAVDGGLTVSDLDNTTLSSAHVAITGNFQSSEDVLAFSNTDSSTYGNIVGSYNAGIGVLTLTSSGATATLAEWQAALRAVTYSDSSASPNTSTRVISFSINDGAKDSAVVSRNVIMQLPAPTVSGLSPGTDTGSNNHDGVTSDSTPTIVGTAIANSDITIYVDGVSVGVTTADGTGAWSFGLLTTLSDGPHAITAMASSGAVNSGVSTAYGVSIDTGAPSVPSGLGLSSATDTGSSSSDGVTGNNQPTLTGTAEANSAVTVYVDGVAVGTAMADGSGAWSYSLTSALSDGSHSIRATSTDLAGNASTQSSAYAITVDTVAPQVASITPLDTLSTSASSVSYDVVFSEPITGLDAGAISIVTSGSAHGSVAAITKLSESHYLVQLSGVGGDGSLAIAVRAGGVTDMAGNAIQQQVVATAYQVLTPVIQPPVTVTPEIVAAPSSESPIIEIAPITPNIVLEAVASSGSNTIAMFASDIFSVANEVRSIVPPLQLAFGQDHFSSVAPNRLPTGQMPPPGTSDNGFALPFVSRLTLAQGAPLQVLPDLGVRSLIVGQTFSFGLPPGTVLTRNPDVVLSISARQSNGQPLPSWIRFDPKTGRFSGTVPAGWNKSVSLEVTVQDQDGHRGVTRIQIKADGQAAVPAEGEEASPASGKSSLNEQFLQHGKSAFEQQLAQWLQPDNVV
ncbi:DUF4347 domain-containing protein [Pseudogulbenkiania ferrooxidans]|nr:DUF4347 domain-containing protein [Pseudogulbenkiania ferrooxidans]